jgi:hypothetical protein
MTTKEMECYIYNHLWKQGTYLCFEVAMPCLIQGTRCSVVKERVDLLSHDSKGNWRFYELKVSKSDFHSKAKKTFLGNYNYYVMPLELYKQVKDEIPDDIGVWTVYESNYGRKHGFCNCVKKPKRKELQVDREELMFNFMQALSREYRKYRKHINKKMLEGSESNE